MEFIKANKFVMVGYRCRVEAGANCMVKKVYFCLETDGEWILCLKTCLSLAFGFGAVDG